MNFFKIWYLTTLSLIGLSRTNPNEQSGVVFDIKKIKGSNFTIYEGLNEAIEGQTTYQFVPKAGTKVVKVKNEDTLLWKKVDETSVEDITLSNSVPFSYYFSVGIVNKESKKSYLYYKVLYSMFNDTGIAEHFHAISTVHLKLKTYKTFDINSIFDYRYLDKKQKYAPSELLNIVEFQAEGFEYVDIITDGQTELYHDKKIQFITLTQKKSEKYLLKLKTTSYTHVYFQYDTKWKRINQEEYNKLLPKELKTFDIGSYSSAKVTDTKLDIGSKFKPYSQDKAEFLTVPTMIHHFENFEELYDGSELIFKEPIKRAKIMVYRGKTTNQMIEIVHMIKRTLGDTPDSEGEVNGNHFNLGKLNIYFIKKENKWTRCDQLEFLNQFKRLVNSNLEEYNAKAQGQIAELGKMTSRWSAEIEERTLNDHINNNKKSMAIVSSIKLRDTAHRREITLESLLKNDKIYTEKSKEKKPTTNEREEPMPKKEPKINTEIPKKPKQEPDISSEIPKKPKHQEEFHDEWKMVPYTRGDEFEPRENPIDSEDTSNVGETDTSNVGETDTINTGKQDTGNEETPTSKDSGPEKKQKPTKLVEEEVRRPWNPIKPNEVLNKPEASKGTIKKNVSEEDGQLRSVKPGEDTKPKEVKKSESTFALSKEEKGGFYTQSFLLFLPILFLIT